MEQYYQNNPGEYNQSQYNQSTYNQSEYNQGSYIPEPDIPKAPNKKKGGLGKVIAYALVFGIVGGGVFFGVNTGLKYITKGPEVSIQTASLNNNIYAPAGSTVIATDVSGTVAEVMPGVVSITAVTVKEYKDMFGRTGTQVGSGQGSGFIMSQNDNELFIMTNYHVVEGKASLTVGFCDGEGAEATVKATDSSTDLAIVSVKLTSLKDSTKAAIKVLTLADSSQVVVGQTAIAIGNALGYGQSVTCGIISKTSQTINNGTAIYTVLQTDAAINSGNSGGPLFNAKGEVIAVNDAKSNQELTEGVCWAIPINSAKALIDMANMGGGDVTPIKQNGQSIYDYFVNGWGNNSGSGNSNSNSGSGSDSGTDAGDDSTTEGRRLLGVTVITIGEEESKQYNVPMGVYISKVNEGSVAEKAGLKQGDVITSFNNIKVSTNEELVELIQGISDGQAVRIEYQKLIGNSYTSTSTTAQF